MNSFPEVITVGVGPLGYVLGAVAVEAVEINRQSAWITLPPQTLRTPVAKETTLNKLRTPQEAREWLSYLGITIAQWAREHGFSEPLVREILAGRKKCLRGQSHNIAVALGMKRGVPTTRPARVAPTRGATRASYTGAVA